MTRLSLLCSRISGGDFEKVEKVPNGDSNITPIANGVFDAAWIYYGWDGILNRKGCGCQLYTAKDYVREFDTTAVIIITTTI